MWPEGQAGEQYSKGHGLRASLGAASWGRRWELVSLQVDPDSGLRVGSCPGPGRQSEPSRAAEGAGCGAGPLCRVGQCRNFQGKAGPRSVWAGSGVTG